MAFFLLSILLRVIVKLKKAQFPEIRRIVLEHIKTVKSGMILFGKIKS